MGADHAAHKSSLLAVFYGRDSRVTRQKGGRLAQQLNMHRQKTRAALLEYISPPVFIAASGSEGEISRASDPWVCPAPFPAAVGALRALRLPADVALLLFAFSPILAPV